MSAKTWSEEELTPPPPPPPHARRRRPRRRRRRRPPPPPPPSSSTSSPGSGLELSTPERDELKKVAHVLLERLKSLLVLSWREKSQARAQIRQAIEDELDRGLPPAYTRDIYGRKCSQLFEHVYENYSGEGSSVFTSAA